MLKVVVVNADGSTDTASTNTVVVCDEATNTPLVLVRRVGGAVEYLNADDGQRFNEALSSAVYPSQLGLQPPTRVVKT